MSDDKILDISWKMQPRNSHGQFMRKNYSDEISRVVNTAIDELADKELNKAIRKYNSVINKRINRLRDSHLLHISSGANAMAGILGLDLDNFKLPSATSLGDKSAKVKYLAMLSHSIDDKTLTVGGAKQWRDKIAGELKSKPDDPAILEDLILKIFEMKDESKYSNINRSTLFDFINEYQSEIDNIKEELENDPENAYIEFGRTMGKIKRDISTGINNVDKALNNAFSNTKHYDSDL
jgi:hypothetical protein